MLGETETNEAFLHGDSLLGVGLSSRVIILHSLHCRPAAWSGPCPPADPRALQQMATAAGEKGRSRSGSPASPLLPCPRSLHQCAHSHAGALDLDLCTS